ncbi:hypothetical protein EOA85_08540 [Mesorhizobium sp. M5C.F.Ca.IN.020.29.1.1]|uniref:hypothetical protein n=1 Tax=unclassified Mesorhizobium TaxID=325217 RepID=UPI000FCB7E4F|nr:MULTISPECIES: hypothetical protein [unclassified Mesorhizobium]RUV60874.1 hypothetical protein EOA85_08540 [Mesorhizobium sp. M5C.F.Ca.IN.020.29.1.1]TIM85997.1 MAG: hypothetical protein E5Y50_17025 [Mesorhizobium sp.]
MVQTGCSTQNIPLADGAGHTLPAAAPIARRPDRGGLPVTLLRQTDGKVRYDGSSAAFVQPINPVAERGRLHGASELVPKRGIVAERINSYIIAQKERSDDVEKITGSTTD